jgi:hypothetical protein
MAAAALQLLAPAAEHQQLKQQPLITELRVLRAAHGSVCAQLVDACARLERLYGANAELEASEAHWRVSERAPRALRARAPAAPRTRSLARRFCPRVRAVALEAHLAAARRRGGSG